MSAKPQCRGITQSGERCPMQGGLSEDGLCLWHDPERAEEAQAARLRGQKNRGNGPKPPEGEPPRPPETLNDLISWTAWIVSETAAGRLDHRTARALTYAIATSRVAMERRDLGEQVRKLERQLKQLKQAQ